MDRLDAMAVLLKVVEEGSLSAGARRLNTSLPTISRKVAELERYLGTQLLIRTARRVELTEAGEVYVQASRRIMEQVEEAERTAAGEYVAPRGELTVTAPVMFGRKHVLPVASDFLEAHPDITLKLYLADKNVSIAEEHVHVAVRIGELTDNSFMATRVASVTRTVCASPAYLERFGRPSTPDQLEGHATVVIGGFAEAQRWTFEHDGATIPIDLRPRVTVNTPEAALDATLAGLGIGRLLSYQAVDEIRAGLLTPLLQEFAPPAMPVSLVYPSQGMLPAKVRAFLNWMAPRLRARLTNI